MSIETLNLRNRQVFFGSRARLLYEIIGWAFQDASDLRFMNYGYSDESLAPPLPAEQEPERTSAQLYHLVAAQVRLGGRRVLDVGSGRGGGTAYVHRAFGAAETVGCDIAQQAVRFCQRVHDGVPGLSFVRGDALALPFADCSFDAVVNVESSHCYPDRSGFFQEVARVLRPGGAFLFADFTPPLTAPAAEVDRIAGGLARAGFTGSACRDITPGILRGLDLDHDRRCAEIRARFPLGTRRMAQLWAGTRGSWIYRDFAEGRRGYFLWKAELSARPAPVSPPQPTASSAVPLPGEPAVPVL